MKLFLDDYRKPYFGWDLVTDAESCIVALSDNFGYVEWLSLDHDLCDAHYAGSVDEQTGMAVVDWMIMTDYPKIPVVVHSMNPVGAQRMVQTLRAAGYETYYMIYNGRDPIESVR